MAYMMCARRGSRRRIVAVGQTRMSSSLATVSARRKGAISQRYGGQGGPDFILICRPADLVDKVLALELGAADVVESPLNVRELAARVGGLLSRRGRGTQELIVLENATVDLRSAIVMHRSGTEEQLSPGQVALLRLFLASPRKVLTRDDIIAAAPAENADAFDRSIDSRIVRLRRKLDTETITTIRGTGYRFDPPTQRATEQGWTLGLSFLASRPMFHFGVTDARETQAHQQQRKVLMACHWPCEADLIGLGRSCS